MPQTNAYNMHHCVKALYRLGFLRVGYSLEFRRPLGDTLDYGALHQVGEVMALLGYEAEYIVINSSRIPDGVSMAERRARTVRGVRYVHVAN